MYLSRAFGEGIDVGGLDVDHYGLCRPSNCIPRRVQQPPEPLSHLLLVLVHTLTGHLHTCVISRGTF